MSIVSKKDSILDAITLANELALANDNHYHVINLGKKKFGVYEGFRAGGVNYIARPDTLRWYLERGVPNYPIGKEGG